MKPVKESLKNEIIHRILLLQKSMDDELQKPKDENNMYWWFAMEHSNYNEFLNCIDFYERTEIKKQFDISKATPLVCKKTNKPIFIGDLVERSETGKQKNPCGILVWDDFFNEYLIKNEFGNNTRFRALNKIEELHDYHIDTTGVECRRGR